MYRFPWFKHSNELLFHEQYVGVNGKMFWSRKLDVALPANVPFYYIEKHVKRTFLVDTYHHKFNHGFRKNQGWGLLSQFSPFRYFPHFPLLSKQTLAIEYRVHIWQVSPQLSCGDTFQIWMWFRESNRYFCKIENFAYGEISERSFSNPHPRPSRRSSMAISKDGILARCFINSMSEDLDLVAIAKSFQLLVLFFYYEGIMKK